MVNVDYTFLAKIGLTLLLIIILISATILLIAYIEWAKKTLKERYSLDIDYLVTKSLWIFAFTVIFYLIFHSL